MAKKKNYFHRYQMLRRELRIPVEILAILNSKITPIELMGLLHQAGRKEFPGELGALIKTQQPNWKQIINSLVDKGLLVENYWLEVQPGITELVMCEVVSNNLLPFYRHMLDVVWDMPGNDLRLGIYLNDPIALNALLAKTHLDDMRQTQMIYGFKAIESACVRNGRIESMGLIERLTLYFPIAMDAFFEGDYQSPYIETFQAAIAEEGAEDWALYHPACAELKYLLGDIKGALVHANQGADCYCEHWRGALEFIRTGETAETLKTMSGALTKLRKFQGKRRTFFVGPSSSLHLMALLASRDEKSLKQCIRLTESIINYGNPRSGFFGNVRRAAEVIGSIHSSSNFRIWGKEFYPEYVLDLIVQVWLNPKGYDNYQLFEDALAGMPMNWHSAEIHAVLAAAGHNMAFHAAESDRRHQELDVIALAELVKLDPPWKRVMASLRELTTEPVVEERDERVIWSVNFPLFDCSPVLQKKNRKGWTKGRPIALESWRSQPPSCATKQDRKTHEAVFMEQGWSRLEPRWDYQKLFAALVGHPLIFDVKNERIKLERGEPRLEVTRIGGQLQVNLVPKINDSFGIVHEGSNLWRFYEYGSIHQEISRLLGKGLDLPPGAEQELVETLDALSENVMVQADLAAGRETKDGERRLHVALAPLAEGLEIRIQVRPAGVDGPGFEPGVGGSTLFIHVDGKPQSLSRDLDDERARLKTLLKACPNLATCDEERGALVQPHPEACLVLLLEIQAMGDEVIAIWPEGNPWRVDEVAANALQVRLEHEQDWFSVSGQLRVNEQLVLDLKEVLDMLRRQKGRFFALGENRFLALSRHYRDYLEEMDAMADLDDEAKIHPLALPAFEGLADEIGRVDGDKQWKQTRERLNRVPDQEPVVPNTFQGELRAYQHNGFTWMAGLDALGVGACLADDMGLGKTVQILAFMLTVAPDGPLLVVAPTSVCANWMEEARRFAPTLNAQRLGDGDRSELLSDAGPFDLIVVSYGLLQQEIDLLEQVDWRMAVLDEAQAIKNPSAKRTRAAYRLKAGFRVVATGTPVENHLGELWSLFRFINPGLLDNQKNFVSRYVNPISKRSDEAASGALKRLVQPFILRRLKNQVLAELPARTEVTLKVALSHEESAFYEALRRGAVSELQKSDEDEPGHIRILAEIMRLRRACCHPRLVDPSSALTSSKLSMFGEVVTELLANRHKALVFSQFVDHLQLIRDWLDEQKISYQYLDGSTPAKARQNRVRAFQAGEGDLFLISLKAGGTGLNLTAADFVIHMDPWWNPAVEDQASDRAHRMGQQRPVTVYRLVAEKTIEEKIVALHARKRHLAERLLEGTDVAGSLSADALLALIKER